MAKNKRLSPNELSREKGYFTNLKNISGYRSQNPAYEVAAIQPIEDLIESSLDEETRLVARLAEVRDIIAENSTKFVEKNDGAALQVAAQFGEDSPEYQSMGRTRKSERSTNRRPNSGGNTPNG